VSSVISASEAKFGMSLTDDSRVVIYDRYTFIIQATGRGPMTYLGQEQGMLAEGQSVQLTSSLRQLVL
jgi:hypothetical protein